MMRLVFRAVLALGLSGAPLLLVMPGPGPALAQGASDLKAAKAAGLVGERPDGLIGPVSASPSAETLRLVAAINQQRQAQYGKIAGQNGISAAQVGAVAGKELIARTPPGQYVMNAGGTWVKK